ncbi:hypothetical protein FQN54_006366 [Arachnomyces sp. PD_36]|nr:hypothetical protein FQN54_006366 [Arachnomyces sp. PD_36]
MASPFATNLYRLLHGNKENRELHRVYQKRHKAGVRKLSKCHHKFPVRRTKSQKQQVIEARTDSKMFQHWAKYNDFPLIGLEWVRHEREEGIRKFLFECCPILTNKFIIYGVIGRGSYGVIFAARERYPPDGRKAKHYAMKVERHVPVCKDNLSMLSTNCRYKELADTASNAPLRYLPREAVLLRLLSGSDRFPKVHSAYVHDQFQVIVMSADSLDPDPIRDSLGSIMSYPTQLKFPGYPGTNLMQRRRKGTKLKEIEVCKVASQLLEALMYLMDMNIIHDDLSHRNYLVDSELNTQLIDLGLVKLALQEKDFREDYWTFIEPQEYQMSPELAIEMSKDYWRQKEEATDVTFLQVDVLLPHDSRHAMIWKFGVLIYDLLHGYSPWEDSDDLEVVPLRTHPLTKASMYPGYFPSDMTGPGPKDRVPSRQDILDRRHRIINKELQIAEHLTQDCVDVLRSMLDKDPTKRPSLRDLCSYPWFQGHWVDQGPFRRPGRTGTSVYPSPK